jgi:predicted RecA/RadA family phage recombinase
MGNYSPRHKPGKDLTYAATTDITAGQCVEVTGNYMAGVPAAAGTLKFLGVAVFDVKAGDRVNVTSGGVQVLVADGPIAAGDHVQVSTQGRVKTATDATTIGTALTAAASGATADIRLDV